MIATGKITALVLILFSLPAIAQDHFIGIKTGANLTNVLKSDFWSGTENRFGINAGVTYEVMLNEKFTLGADFQYTQKGFRMTSTFTDEFGNAAGEPFTQRFNYDYVSIPLKAGFTFGDKLSGFVNLGVVPSMLLEARTISPPIAQIPQQIYLVTRSVTKFDLGGMLEIGANYSVNTDYVVFASAGFQQSAMSITNEHYYSNSKIWHYGLSLSVGCKYLLPSGESKAG